MPDSIFDMNAALQTRAEVEDFCARSERLNIATHPDRPKNWDNLKAHLFAREHFTPDARILDAGADREPTSVFLPGLRDAGYQNLFGMNLIYAKDRERHRDITYIRGDVTHTPFEDNYFDLITCLSVIEHGVNLRGYFQEAHRILKPGGVLITSTDYWPAKIVNDRGVEVFGVPVQILSHEEIIASLQLARRFRLEPVSPFDPSVHEKTISWAGFDYTFVLLTLTKRSESPDSTLCLKSPRESDRTRELLREAMVKTQPSPTARRC
jgi:SAM-dependent methyltransferase